MGPYLEAVSKVWPRTSMGFFLHLSEKYLCSMKDLISVGFIAVKWEDLIRTMLYLVSWGSCITGWKAFARWLIEWKNSSSPGEPDWKVFFFSSVCSATKKWCGLGRWKTESSSTVLIMSMKSIAAAENSKVSPASCNHTTVTIVAASHLATVSVL